MNDAEEDRNLPGIEICTCCDEAHIIVNTVRVVAAQISHFYQQGLGSIVQPLHHRRCGKLARLRRP